MKRRHCAFYHILVLVVIGPLMTGCSSSNIPSGAPVTPMVSDTDMPTMDVTAALTDSPVVTNSVAAAPITSVAVLTDKQRMSINMLNYLVVLTQEVNSSKNSRLYLEEAYSSLYNNTHPNAVDARTQVEIGFMFDTIGTTV